jgi:hypothetical protein
MNTMYFVTHKASAPVTKGPKWARTTHWDFLAVTPYREEAERLLKTLPRATGIIKRKVGQRE